MQGIPHCFVVQFHSTAEAAAWLDALDFGKYVTGNRHGGEPEPDSSE